MVAHSVYKDPGWIPSLPLSKKWHKLPFAFLLQLLWVFPLSGRSTDGIFPVGSPYQRLSRASCHLKVGADGGVGLSVSWSRGQTQGIIGVQLQTASSAHVHPCECCRSWCPSKVTLLCLLPILGHWLHSSPGQTELKRDDLSFLSVAWRRGEDGGMLVLSHLPCCKPGFGSSWGGYTLS